MEIQDIKKAQDAIYQRLVAGGVDISRAELAVDGQTLAKSREAAALMVAAMEAQNEFNNNHSGVAVKIEAGLEVGEDERADYEDGLDNCKQAIQNYSDAHILAHRTEYAAQLSAYRAADASTLKKLAEYRYDRDAVDTVISTTARKEWKEKHPEIQGKNCLLVGRNAIEDGIDQLIESNTHSPIPIKDAVSTRVKVPYGEPMYPMLNPALEQDNNDLRPVDTFVPEKAAEAVEEEKQAEQEKPAIRRVTRTYTDEPSATRRRTTIAADLLFEEKVKRGIKYSPDPMTEKQKAKSRGKDMDDLDGILTLKANNEDGSGV